jgi:mRNA-degrading endonuclease HigB of HigAB toxin-antitoxin module
MILIGREHITVYTQQFPTASAGLAMWRVITQKAAWRDQTETTSCFPAVRFLTPKMARFYPANCVVTAQIAFNTGILIVLAVTANTQQIQES